MSGDFYSWCYKVMEAVDKMNIEVDEPLTSNCLNENVEGNTFDADYFNDRGDTKKQTMEFSTSDVNLLSGMAHNVSPISLTTSFAQTEFDDSFNHEIIDGLELEITTSEPYYATQNSEKAAMDSHCTQTNFNAKEEEDEEEEIDILSEDDIVSSPELYNNIQKGMNEPAILNNLNELHKKNNVGISVAQINAHSTQTQFKSAEDELNMANVSVDFISASQTNFNTTETETSAEEKNMNDVVDLISIPQMNFIATQTDFEGVADKLNIDDIQTDITSTPKTNFNATQTDPEVIAGEKNIDDVPIDLIEKSFNVSEIAFEWACYSEEQNIFNAQRDLISASQKSFGATQTEFDGAYNEQNFDIVPLDLTSASQKSSSAVETEFEHASNEQNFDDVPLDSILDSQNCFEAPQNGFDGAYNVQNMHNVPPNFISASQNSLNTIRTAFKGAGNEQNMNKVPLDSTCASHSSFNAAQNGFEGADKEQNMDMVPLDSNLATQNSFNAVQIGFEGVNKEQTMNIATLDLCVPEEVPQNRTPVAEQQKRKTKVRKITRKRRMITRHGDIIRLIEKQEGFTTKSGRVVKAIQRLNL